MSRLYAQLWVTLPATALFFLVSSLCARAQDPLADAPLAPGSVIPTDGSDQNKANPTSKTDTKSRAKSVPEFVVKTDAEWRKILTRVQYAVTRQKWTEPPFSGNYATGHFAGTFLCVCCDAPLFAADSKFESGTGWPSFDRPASAKAIQTAWDYSEIEPRVEVMCRRCRAHLGHVFEDGPTRTGLRYCINSAAIKLNSTASPGARKTVSRAAASKANARARPKSKSKSMRGPAPEKTGAPAASSAADSDNPPSKDRVKSNSDSSSPSS